jgi:hypothetical protein
MNSSLTPIQEDALKYVLDLGTHKMESAGALYMIDAFEAGAKYGINKAAQVAEDFFPNEGFFAGISAEDVPNEETLSYCAGQSIRALIKGKD